jgi:polar amino acid transport system substrate-binding protein
MGKRTIGLWSHRGGGDIVAEFDRHIESMRADGTYNRLLDLSWIRTDVDGDGGDDHVSEGEAAAGSPDDPRKTQSGYPLFRSVEPAGSSSGNPLYVIDGKPYRSWNEVSSTLKTSAGKPTRPPRQDEAGVVLLQF